jgi:hypothetical protein
MTLTDALLARNSAYWGKGTLIQNEGIVRLKVCSADSRAN